jgi:outer membrane immunogenic protein
MKRFVAASMAAFVGLMVQASAADLGRAPRVAPAPVFAPVYSWQGLYIGVNGGGGWGNSTWTGVSNDFNTSGGLFGGQIGYNWQFGQTVLGLETDIQWSGIKGSGACAFGCETKNNWFGTARGRLGYAYDRFLPYVTGGLAYGNIEANPSFGFTSASTTNAGWTVGAGVEFALMQNWTAKVEYLYVNLGDFNTAVSAPGFTNVDFTANVVRAGVNFRF